MSHKEVRSGKGLPCPYPCGSHWVAVSVGFLQTLFGMPPLFSPVGDDKRVFLTRDTFQKCSKFSGRDRVGWFRRMLALYWAGRPC